MNSDHLLQQQLEKLTRIGIALSAERDLNRLLDLLVDEARSLTSADGGTLYLVEGDPAESLRYHVMQTASMGVRSGGATGRPITIPNLPLKSGEEPNYQNISAYVANTGRTVNVPDWRDFEGFDFTGPRKFEETTGYRSKSFLVVALRDHEDQIIGVLQLINKMDGDLSHLTEFTPADVQLIEALASQAAVAITNTRLIRELEHLFEAFAEVMASAIDERSPATSGHIKRVATLTTALAEAVNREQTGRFAGVYFDQDQLNELRLASLLHDVGKITTPIHVVEKRGKLERVYDRIGEVRTRFDLARKAAETEFLRRKLDLVQSGAPPEAVAALDAEAELSLKELEEDRDFIVEMNTPVEFLQPELVERIRAIGAKSFLLDGMLQPLISPDELRNLTVQRGNITGEELQMMRDHATVSIKLLSQIPFTRRLRNIPAYAGAHHEMLNGKGYPLGLKGDQIPVQTRMMTIADIYDAITASDRSYKKARSQEDALKVLQKAAQFGEVDPDLVELFIASGAYKLTGKSAAEMEAEVVLNLAAAGKQPK